jgi:hypothetical protein
MTDANYILTKLHYLEQKDFTTWSESDKKSILDIYLLISKNESKLLDLVYSYHDDDSYQYICRDYDSHAIKLKVNSIEIALDIMIDKCS